MSADILFGEKKMWSARTTGFNEVIDRVILRCNKADKCITSHLNIAKDVGCLCIDDLNNPDDRDRLVRHILATAIELLKALQGNPHADSHEIEGVRNLVSLSREHLIETGTNGK